MEYIGGLHLRMEQQSSGLSDYNLVESLTIRIIGHEEGRDYQADEDSGAENAGKGTWCSVVSPIQRFPVHLNTRDGLHRRSIED